MHRNGILRFYQGVDQFDLFLTGMTGYMYVLENNVCTLHGKLIDNTGNCLFISRDRVGTEHDRIVRFDRNFFMHATCHTGQCRHGLSLASGRDHNRFLIRIIFQFFNIDQRIVRNINVAKLRRDADDIHHTASFHDNFSAVFISCINDLLHTVYVRRKCCNDNPRILVICKDLIKGLADCLF